MIHVLLNTRRGQRQLNAPDGALWSDQSKDWVCQLGFNRCFIGGRESRTKGGLFLNVQVRLRFCVHFLIFISIAMRRLPTLFTLIPLYGYLTLAI